MAEQTWTDNVTGESLLPSPEPSEFTLDASKVGDPNAKLAKKELFVGGIIILVAFIFMVALNALYGQEKPPEGPK